MLSTSLAAVLSGVMATASAAVPAWQTDYSTALVRAAESNKPIAVFIAQGGAGYARVVAEGNLTADDARRLKQSYVCVYIDTGTAKGKRLAEAFAMTEGLVISNRTGEKQALRHEGKVARAELTTYLVRYADPERVLVTTETPALLSQPTQAVTAQPVVAQPVYYQPVRPAPAACST